MIHLLWYTKVVSIEVPINGIIKQIIKPTSEHRIKDRNNIDVNVGLNDECLSIGLVINKHPMVEPTTVILF